MTARWNSECISCLSQKYLTDFPEDTPEEKRLEYMNGILSILAAAKPEEGAPVITARILAFQKELLAHCLDYTEIKRRFNQLMLEQEPLIAEKIKASDDPLRKAVQYVMAGNYIDFGTLEHVEDGKLFELLSAADSGKLDESAYRELRHDLGLAGKLVYITDNCGEIVLDKLLLQTILAQFPNIHADILVRGMPTLNDASMEDAKQVGLSSVAPVSGNGTDIPGTYLPEISEEAHRILSNADLIISKGQGNFETLRGCGLNIYYIFLCKCQLFTKRFQKKQYEGILTNERRYSESSNYDIR